VIDLYRFWSREDELLYIGISMHAAIRAMNHRTEKRYTWWPLVCRMDIEHLDIDDRNEALTIEALAIRNERPLYNGTHNAHRVPFRPPRVMEGPVHMVYRFGGRAFPITYPEWCSLLDLTMTCECGYSTRALTHKNRHRVTRGHWPGAESSVWLPGRDNSGIWPRPNMWFARREDPETLIEYDPDARWKLT
jgi:predicted GIY-YIG superfamily endonuclease